MLRRNFKFYLSIFLNVVLIAWFLIKYKNSSVIKLTINRSKLNVDQRAEPNKLTILQHIAKNIPYLPIEDLGVFFSKVRNYNYTCARYPGIMDIHIQNEYWQILRNRNLTYYLYGAYLDDRPLVTGNRTLIRLLAIIDLISENQQDYPRTYCQLWFKDKFEPLIVPVETTHFIWRYRWGHDSQYSFPHILTCNLPEDYKDLIPKSVSLVAAPCNKASNILRVIKRPLKPFEKKKEFAVCIKGLDFPYKDISYRLVEYIESLRVLGAQKVIVYNLEVHDNVTKVLNYYQHTGFVEYRPFSFSLKYSNLPEFRHLQLITKKDAFRLHESILYNDCIYRNMYQFKYIAVWDIDELPIPLKRYKNWHDLMLLAENSKEYMCKSYASFCFLCAYFPSYKGNFSFAKEFPEYFYMLQHVKRVRDIADYGYAMKCLHSTDHIIATHNHFPVHYAADSRDYTFSSSVAQMNHYREPPFKENLTNPIMDKSLWRFARRIVKKSMKIFEELDFFEKF
ncbi:uncharacterized protein LOC119606856 [Lucilia sericata]|uniref:uncharacterized protein LOC119606856 n=1 Tax=Lucilia sericata TaxID=13632 RepID=UPI0018A7F114|nr:uncharacterized protein LOC119606856 [Lucilia sericata]